jgi:uncharacterized repeat protein (TIGR01451 family)
MRSLHRLTAMALGAFAIVASPLVLATVNVAVGVSNPTPVAGGAAFTYTVTVSNSDLALAATDVAMTFPLPQGVLFQNLSLVEISPAGGSSGFFSCDQRPAVGQPGTLVCHAPSFPASTAMTTTTATFSVVAQITPRVASGVRTATARVAANGLATQQSQGINIQVDAPLTISMTATPGARPGDTIAYRIAVSNSGSTTAFNASISDTLPPNTTFVDLFAAGAFHDRCFYEAAANSVQCTCLSFPTGQHALTLIVDTSPTTPLGPLSNTAVISSPGTGSISTGMAMVNTTIDAGVPDPPTNLAALAGNGFASVSFTPPESDGGAPIISYTVTCTPTAGAPVSAMAVGTTILVGGMTNGLTYTCTAHATNSEGNSVESEPSNPVTPTAAGMFGLTVNLAGSGTGYVESNPPGIMCQADCTQSYSAGTGVELTAGATGLSVFTGWLGGGCTGTGACIVTMDAAKSVTATFAQQGTVPTLDIDASAPGTKYDALTDGLLAIRYLFGLSGASLTANAVGPTATRNNTQIATYLTDIRPALDIDGNGIADALTDGLLVIRRLFGLTGSTLTQNAIGIGAKRNNAMAIDGYLQQLMP